MTFFRAPNVLSAVQLAEITSAELAAGLTAIVPPKPGETWAVSANGHWDYEERSPRVWAIWDRRAGRLLTYAETPNHARRLTFHIDHPLHDHPRPEPRAARYTIADRDDRRAPARRPHW